MKMKKFIIFLLVFASAMPAVTLYPAVIKPDTAEYYLSEGMFYLNSGSFDMAEKQLLTALKKKPALVDAIHGLGIVYLNKRDFKKSVEYFQQVVRINPNSYDAYNYLGIAYSELGEYNLAKENLLTAANADKYRTPENAFVNLAMLEIREKRFDAATRYVDKGMEKNPRFAPLFNLRGVIAENEGKFQDALNWYEQGLALLKEEDATYLVNMGRVYIKLDQKNKALDILEKALSKATNEQIKNQVREMIKSIE